MPLSIVPRPTTKNRLAPDQPHEPAGYKHSADEHGEAVETVAHLLFCGVLLGDAEDYRRKQGKDDRGREVRQGDGHGFFPSAAKAAFKTVAFLAALERCTTQNLVPRLVTAFSPARCDARRRRR